MPLTIARRRSLGTGAFSPASISGLVAWYDASTLGLTDASSISAWTDLSGNGQTMTAAGSARPTFHSTGGNLINGRSVATFDGSANRMATSSAVTTVTTNWSIFLVCTVTGFGGVGVCPIFNGSGGSNGWGIAGCTAGTTKPGWLAGGIAWEPVTNAISIATHLYELVYTSSASMWIDAVSDAPGTTTPNTPTTATYLGSHDGSNFWPGSIGEVVVYSAAVSSGNRALLESYFNTKWGV